MKSTIMTILVSATAVLGTLLGVRETNLANYKLEELKINKETILQSYNYKRLKLEEIYLSFNLFDKLITEYIDAKIAILNKKDVTTPIMEDSLIKEISKLEMYVALYFPKLEDRFITFSNKVTTKLDNLEDTKMSDTELIEKYKKFKKTYREVAKKFNDSIKIEFKITTILPFKLQ
ncbi:MAG: hypothetical protein HRT41_12890 [Campylobacteraceae bacterium]|nr:hypothetical protein [Campylobacteraceae bacterium]